VRHGQTGWLFKPGDVGELAGALKEGLEDPIRSAQQGQNGLKWVRARFTTRQMCAATLSVYRQLITARTG
jgi:glycosyltransferase involved in cell wall biosynthesis